MKIFSKSRENSKMYRLFLLESRTLSFFNLYLKGHFPPISLSFVSSPLPSVLSLPSLFLPVPPPSCLSLCSMSVCMYMCLCIYCHELLCAGECDVCLDAYGSPRWTLGVFLSLSSYGDRISYWTEPAGLDPLSKKLARESCDYRWVYWIWTLILTNLCSSLCPLSHLSSSSLPLF